MALTLNATETRTSLSTAGWSERTIDKNEVFSLIRFQWYFRGQTDVLTYLVLNISDKRFEINNNRIKKIDSALKILGEA